MRVSVDLASLQGQSLSVLTCRGSWALPTKAPVPNPNPLWPGPRLLPMPTGTCSQHSASAGHAAWPQEGE